MTFNGQKIAEILHLPVYKASKIIGNLRDRGLLQWTHDGDGSEGTYVVITEISRATVEKQESGLKRILWKSHSEIWKREIYPFPGKMKMGKKSPVQGSSGTEATMWRISLRTWEDWKWALKKMLIFL